jgi:hypothetical protein
MLFLNWKTAIATALCAVTCSLSGLAQVGLAQSVPPVILRIQTRNSVSYNYDVTDPSTFATRQNVTPPVASRNFLNQLGIGDIVTVNGQPVKGAVVVRNTSIGLSPDPARGGAIADMERGSAGDYRFEILHPDGSPIGTLTAIGFAGPGAAPPGAPLSATRSNLAIVGGTGAFFGARGQAALVAGGGPRQASVAEDPGNRRANGGGGNLYFFHLIPMTRPEIMVTPNGPSVFHGDFTAVTAAKPARAGEVLIVAAANLGPTRPGVDPGKPFPPYPDNPLQEVNSPVEVMVNGQAAEVINKIGWPGLENVYRVDFRVPAGTAAGMASVQLSAAWIPGPPVNIQIQ